MAKQSQRSRPIKLEWPMGGVSRRGPYRAPQGFTTREAVNVRPVGPFEERRRGGSRPGLIKSHLDLLGSGNPVRLLANVTWMDDSGMQVFSETWDAPVGTIFEPAGD